MSEKITAWITKYALTEGIYEGDFQYDVEKNLINMIWSYSNGAQYFHNGDWHKTKQEAVIKAESMRLKKIESLKKQISKLEKLRFE